MQGQTWTNAAPLRTSGGTDMAGLREEFKRSCSQISMGLVEEASLGVVDDVPLRPLSTTIAAPRRTSRGNDFGALREEFKRSCSQMQLDLAKEASVEVDVPLRPTTSMSAAPRRTSERTDVVSLREGFKKSYSQLHMDLAKEASMEVGVPTRSPTSTRTASRRTLGGTDLAALREELKRSCSQLHMDLAKEVSIGANVPTRSPILTKATALRPGLASLSEEFKRSCSKIYMGFEEEASLAVDIARTSKSNTVDEDSSANDRSHTTILQTSGGAKDMEAWNAEFAVFCSQITKGFAIEASVTVDIARASQSEL
jgi:hypothetical protein